MLNIINLCKVQVYTLLFLLHFRSSRRHYQILMALCMCGFDPEFLIHMSLNMLWMTTSHSSHRLLEKLNWNKFYFNLI